MRKWNSERGMSLVEATIILMVLAILTAVVAPSIGDYANDAKSTKAAEDVEAIGGAIVRLVRDTGYPCLRLDATAACTLTNRVDVVVSAGSTSTVTAADYVGTAATITGGATVNWRGATNQSTQFDLMDDQFVENDNANPYSGPDFTAGGGPRSGLGWRGPYLTGSITGDPWGFMYQASTAFLTVAMNGATVGTGEGAKGGGWKADVIVVSAGQNGIVQTLFGDADTASVGDDVIYVVKGSSR
jgi:type II secretory pathway pseudopilin PulG